MEIAAWYEGTDEEPMTLATVEDVDRLLDRVKADGDDPTFMVPPMAQLAPVEEGMWSILQVGVNGDRGFVVHTDRSGSVITWNGASGEDEVIYDYMGHVREVPASAEVPLTDVRAAAREFLIGNGARPQGITWTS